MLLLCFYNNWLMFVQYVSTNSQKDRKTERQKDRKTERQKDRKIERQKGRKTERQKDRNVSHFEKVFASVTVWLLVIVEP